MVVAYVTVTSLLPNMYKKGLLHRRKKNWLSILLFLLFFPAVTSAKIVDQVAAVVNDDVITASELNKETKERYRAAMRQGSISDTTSIEELRAETLDSIIDRRLIEQKARKMGITITEAEVDQAFSQQILRSGIPKDLFINGMHDAGLSEETYRRNLRASLLQNKLIGIEVQARIVITDEMIEEYYKKNYISQIDSKVYNLLQMGFSWGIDADGRERSKKNALELAKKIRADVILGKDFASLAKKYSDLPSAADGGDIGGFTLDDMAQVMATAVRELRPSEVSKIVETDDSYQFFQLTSFKNHLTVVKDDLENVEEEIRRQLYKEKLQQAYRGWITNLKESAYIKKLH